jgi:type IV secretory pathway VirB6-like protein
MLFTPDPMSDLFAYLSQLMTADAGMFQALGLSLFRGFAVILLAWFGIKTALASAGGQHAIHLDQFASLVITIAFGFAMINYYANPIPGIGTSFYRLITDQGTNLAQQLNAATLQEVKQRLDSMYLGLESPTMIFASALEIIHFVLLVIAIVIAEGAAFAVIAFGYVAAAVVILVGPVFIPFFIVPQMEWLFWNWLKALFQYSFYPVIANAFVFVMGSLLNHFIDSHPPPYSAGDVAALFLPLLFLLFAFVYGIVKIPSLVNSIFAGKSGESVFPRM